MLPAFVDSAAFGLSLFPLPTVALYVGYVAVYWPAIRTRRFETGRPYRYGSQPRSGACGLFYGGAVIRTRADDPTERRTQRWEEILGDVGFRRIEPAARILDCAEVLTEAMDRIARNERLANQGDYQALSILRYTRHVGERLTITDIADGLGDTTATTTNRVNRLQALGYAMIARTQQREDWLRVLTDHEREKLATLLGKLNQAV